MSESFWRVVVPKGDSVKVSLRNRAIHITRAACLSAQTKESEVFSVMMEVRGAKLPLCHLSKHLPYCQVALDESLFPVDREVTFSVAKGSAVVLSGVIAVDDDDVELMSGSFESAGNGMREADIKHEENGEVTGDENEDSDCESSSDESLDATRSAATNANKATGGVADDNDDGDDDDDDDSSTSSSSSSHSNGKTPSSSANVAKRANTAGSAVSRSGPRGVKPEQASESSSSSDDDSSSDSDKSSGADASKPQKRKAGEQTSHGSNVVDTVRGSGPVIDTSSQVTLDYVLKCKDTAKVLDQQANITFVPAEARRLLAPVKHGMKGMRVGGTREIVRPGNCCCCCCCRSTLLVTNMSRSLAVRACLCVLQTVPADEVARHPAVANRVPSHVDLVAVLTLRKVASPVKKVGVVWNIVHGLRKCVCVRGASSVMNHVDYM